MEYIFNADDFGRTQTVNRAITEGFLNGNLDRTTIMVNMPFFEEAVRLSEDHKFKDRVGLHLNLTSGEPMTEKIKHCSRFCTNGIFNGRIFSERKIQLILDHEERHAVCEEITAQIDRFLRSGFILMHLDSHGHVHTFPSIFPLIIRVIKKKRFDSVRISLNVGRPGLKNIYKLLVNSLLKSACGWHSATDYFGDFKSVICNSSWLDMKNGKTEIMLHPNIYDEDMQIGQGLHYSDISEWKRRKNE